jgi:hypothetical protein
MGMDPGKFRAEETYLRAVIDPQQNHNNRSSRAVRRADTAVDEIPADEQLPQGEQHGRDDGANPDISPRDTDRRNDFVCHGKHQRHHHEGNENIRPLPKRCGARDSCGD